jgi:hypothetical protein
MMQEAWAMAQRNQAKAKNKAGYSAFQTRYFDDLSGFVADCLVWEEDEGPTVYQAEILAEITRRQRISVRGPHGLGKTAMMAWIVLWFALTRDGEDWKVVTTASAWRQLDKYLWPEIHKWARRLRWDRIGRPPFDINEIFTLKLRLKTGEAFAVASDNPALIEGAHAEHILYIFDESKSVLPATFDAAEGALTTPGAMAIAMSTPGEPQGRFYEIQSRKPGYDDWWVRHVKKSEVIAAERMTEKWANDRKAQWGETSAVYLNRVEGEFAASDEDSVISLASVERANDRWREINESGKWGDFVCVAVDVARTGENKTVQALRFALGIQALRRSAKEDTMQTAGRVAGAMRAHDGPAVIDVIGIGAGVYDRLREDGLPVIAFNAAARTNFMDQSGQFTFANVRSAAWWNLKELLEEEGSQVALPPDDNLTGDLTAPKWRVMSGGRIQIESKDDIAKRLGRSTDDGDAVVMAYWEGMQVTEFGENPFEGYRG